MQMPERPIRSRVAAKRDARWSQARNFGQQRSSPAISPTVGSAPRARCADRRRDARQGGGGCVHRQARLSRWWSRGPRPSSFEGRRMRSGSCPSSMGGSTAARFYRLRVPTSGFCASASRTQAASNTRSPCGGTAARIGLSTRSIRPEPAILSARTRFAGPMAMRDRSGASRAAHRRVASRTITVRELRVRRERRQERVYLPAGYDPGSNLSPRRHP